MTTGSIYPLFVLLSSVMGNEPCIDYSAVCVPTQAMQRGCHCALIRPGQEGAARDAIQQKFGRRKRETFDDIKFAILKQNGTDQLNRFFPDSDSAPARVDNNVFKWINTQTSSLCVSKSIDEVDNSSESGLNNLDDANES